MKTHFLQWATSIQSVLLVYGPWGLIGVSFVDAGLIPLPEAVDFWVITLCARNPHMMPWYVLAATVGSVAGCMIPYYIGKKGGHAFLERKLGKERADKTRRWFDRHQFLTVMLPALLPPPTPLKAFLLAAGVVEMQVPKFLLALFVGRIVRFFLEGLLAVRYGRAVWRGLVEHGPAVAIVILVLILIWVVAKRFTTETQRTQRKQ